MKLVEVKKIVFEILCCLGMTLKHDHRSKPEKVSRFECRRLLTADMACHAYMCLTCHFSNHVKCPASQNLDFVGTILRFFHKDVYVFSRLCHWSLTFFNSHNFLITF